MTPIETDTGLFVLSAIVDITARKRAEEKFRLAVESAPNAMVMINSEGKIVLTNAQTEKLFGYHRDELLEQPVELLVPDRFRPKHPEYRASFFANPAARSMGVGRDLFGRRKDGTEFPVEIGLNPVQTEDGMMVLSAIVDITERKRAERELRKAHEELEKRVQERTMDLARLAVNLRAQAELLDLANDAIMVRKMNGEITFWNRGAEEIYGWKKSEVEGKRTHSVLRTEFPKGLADIEAELLRDGRWEGTLTHFRKDGSKIVVASRWALKSDEHGQPTTVLEINNDVTARKLAEDKVVAFAAEVQQSNQELAAANKELEAFSYSVSHDLRAFAGNRWVFANSSSAICGRIS